MSKPSTYITHNASVESVVCDEGVLRSLWQIYFLDLDLIYFVSVQILDPNTSTEYMRVFASTRIRSCLLTTILRVFKLLSM